MTFLDARTVPADPTSTERLAASGLAYRVVDWNDQERASAFSRADARGFLGADPSDEELALIKASWAERRNVGVYEPDAEATDFPIATVNSWVTPMTVPGGEIPMWAISSVTVSGTHRRRGIARNLLEGELRAAAEAGVPIAGLTASEATIYSRYGFAPAVPVAELKIDTTRAGWAVPAAPGRIEYVEDREALAVLLGQVHDRSRGQRSGQIPGWRSRWLRMSGLDPDQAKDKGRGVRGIRYLDADGVVRGVAAYRLEECANEFRFTLAVHHIAAETDEALRALWGFLLQHDLVGEVTADLRPIDDPVTWLVTDQRAVTQTVHDHGWLRVLDVPAALSARTYRADLDVVLEVSDPLGIAAGRWQLRIADGRAEVTKTDAVADLSLGVAELSSLYAGGVSAVQVLTAGRIDGTIALAAAIDDAFRAERAPLLGIWY